MNTLVAIPHAIFETLRISGPTMLEGLTGRVGEPHVYDERLFGWSANLVNAAEIDLSVSGRENITPGEPYIVMSNHASLYDIPVLYQALRISMRMVAKAELFRVPLWGAAMKTAGFVAVDRGNRERAIEALQHAKAIMAQGISVWIAPEGTRTRTGKMGRFKQGGFHLALDTGRRILPVAIRGTYDILAPKTMNIRANVSVAVQVLEPIDPHAYGPERRNELADFVRERIAGIVEPESMSTRAPGTEAR